MSSAFLIPWQLGWHKPAGTTNRRRTASGKSSLHPHMAPSIPIPTPLMPSASSGLVSRLAQALKTPPAATDHGVFAKLYRRVYDGSGTTAAPAMPPPQQERPQAPPKPAPVSTAPAAAAPPAPVAAVASPAPAPPAMATPAGLMDKLHADLESLPTSSARMDYMTGLATIIAAALHDLAPAAVLTRSQFAKLTPRQQLDHCSSGGRLIA